MRQSYIADSRMEYDGRWPSPHGDFLVEVKRTNNARDLRGALLTLAMALQKEPPSARGVLVLIDSKLSASRLRDELAQFRGLLRFEIGAQIHLATFSEGRLQREEMDDGLMPNCGDDLAQFIHDLVLHDTATQGGRVSRIFVQSLVIDQWLVGRPLSSSSDVISETGASKPTVIAALEHLQKLEILSGPFGDFSIRPPNWQAWESLAQDLKSERKTVRFVDPSGLARSPMELAKRLSKLKDSKDIDVAIGGVVATYHFYADLNITAPPRLDLSVYNGDLSFVRQLDAGLIETKNLNGYATLVVHLGRRLQPKSVTHTSTSRQMDASPLECMADLVDIGLTAEARDFGHYLNRQAVSGGVLQ